MCWRAYYAYKSTDGEVLSQVYYPVFVFFFFFSLPFLHIIRMHLTSLHAQVETEQADRPEFIEQALLELRPNVSTLWTLGYTNPTTPRAT